MTVMSAKILYGVVQNNDANMHNYTHTHTQVQKTP